MIYKSSFEPIKRAAYKNFFMPNLSRNTSALSKLILFFDFLAPFWESKFQKTMQNFLQIELEKILKTFFFWVFKVIFLKNFVQFANITMTIECA